MAATNETAVRPLTEDQFEQYQRDGYIVVEDLFDPDTVESLKSRIREYTHGGREVPEGTQKQLEPAYDRGEIDVEEPGDAVRKFEWLTPGDDRFTEFVQLEELVDIVHHLIGRHLQLYRSGALLKPPEIGSEKGAHQDAPYWPFQPPEQVSVWIPLDDATPENGCMSVLPGNHREGALPHVKTEEDFVIDPDHYDADEFVDVPMDAGSALFFHPMLPHYTSPNTSDRWRRAVVLVYLHSRTRFDADERPDWIPEEFFDVRGETFPGCVN